MHTTESNVITLWIDIKYTTLLKTIPESTHTFITNIIIGNNKFMEVITVLKNITKSNCTFTSYVIMTDISL